MGLKKDLQPERLKGYINIEKPVGQLQTVKAVITLCYNINKYKDFESIKFKEIGNTTILKRLKSNLLYLEYIDHSSQLYNSIFTLCKKTLEEELKVRKYNYWYYYLLDYFLEMDLKAVVGKKSQEVTFFPEKNLTNNKPEKLKEEESKFIWTSENEILVNPTYTGKQFVRDKQRFEDFKENLNL